MKPFLGRSGAVLVLCLAIGVALGLSGCQGAKSRSNTLSHPEPTTKAERRGDAYLKSGSLKGALQEYERALDEGAPEHVINWRKGNAYFSARMWEKAYVHFRKAINADPDWVLAQEGAGFSAFEMGEFRNALGYFERSRELNPDNWVPYAFLAVIHKVLGNNADAQEANQKAIELAGEDRILADATIKRAYAKAVIVFEEQGDAPESTVTASGVGDDPLSRIESLAAAPDEKPAPSAAAEKRPESSGGWDVVETKRAPGKILGMDSGLPVNATLATNATVLSQAASESSGPRAANATQSSGSETAASDVNATRDIAAASAADDSGLQVSENDSVTVIESPGFEDMNGTLATAGNATSGFNATAAANATGPKSEGAPVPAPAASTEEQQATVSQDTAAEPEPAKQEDEPSEAVARKAEPEPEQTTASAPATAGVEPAESAPAKTESVKPGPAEAEEPETIEKAESADPRVAEAGMVYAVLESSWRDEPDAVKRIADLEKQGVRAHLVPSEVEGKGFWYRVMIGPRKKLQATKDIKTELQSRFGLAGLVILKVPESRF